MQGCPTMRPSAWLAYNRGHNMAFPLSLEHTKLRMQIPLESADQDEHLRAALDASRAIMARFIGAAKVLNPGADYIRIREAALLIVIDIVLHQGGESLASDTVPAWQRLLSDLGNAAKLQALRSQDGDGEEDVYDAIKGTLQASGGLTITPDDDSQRLTFMPVWAASFIRRAGYSIAPVVSAAEATAHGAESNSHVITMPPSVGPTAYVWLWLARPGLSIQAVDVQGIGDAVHQFGAGVALTVGGVLGTLFTTTSAQELAQWAGKAVAIK